MPISAVTANELEVATSLFSSIAIDEKVNVCDADHTEDAERVVEYLQSLELKYRGLLTEISKARDAFNRLLKAQGVRAFGTRARQVRAFWCLFAVSHPGGTAYLDPTLSRGASGGPMSP